MTRLHVAFGMSAGGSLKKAVELLGLDERVICQPDDLGGGPLHPFSAEDRAWYLGLDDEPQHAAQIAAFWDEVSTTKATVVAWLSRRCVNEYCGLLELLCRRSEPPLVVDVTDLEPTFGYVSHETMIERDLFARAAPMSVADFDRERAIWQGLRAENAELRTIDSAGALVSAPVTHFDDLLRSFATVDWRSGLAIVGDAFDEANRGFRRVNDTFLWERVRALVEAGVLEGRGSMSWIRDSQVRQRVISGT